MTAGFIMPVAMGLAEWGLRRAQPDEPATCSGKIQVALMALSFVWILALTLADRPEMAGMGIVFAILALVIVFGRVWPAARHTSLVARRPERHALAAYSPTVCATPALAGRRS